MAPRLAVRQALFNAERRGTICLADAISVQGGGHLSRRLISFLPEQWVDNVNQSTYSWAESTEAELATRRCTQTLPSIPRRVQTADNVLVVITGATLPLKHSLLLQQHSVGGSVDLVWATYHGPSGVWAQSLERLGELCLREARRRESCAETLLGRGGT
ncbi:unnamed protein product [Polarella glacialis]|uniref:Uncharacterized protein n=1 Tax=Polarella glacialis TaxID=89957 RepID=A0A813IUH4_POLGL|nr:unnamed protein product [Polarella glacialis]